MTRKELLKRSKQYFDNPEINVMYATADGNFFYEEGLSYATSHAEDIKLTYGNIIEKISRSEFTKNLPLDKWEKEELQAHCKEQGYPESDWDKLKPKDLVAYIHDMADKSAIDAEEATAELAELNAQLAKLQAFCREAGWDAKQWRDLSLEALEDYIKNQPDPEEVPAEQEQSDIKAAEADEAAAEEKADEADEKEESEEGEQSDDDAAIDAMTADDVSVEDAKAYNEATNKDAVYRGNITSLFKNWKKENK